MNNNNIFNSLAPFVCQEFNPVFNNLSDILSCCSSYSAFESLISQLKWEIVRGGNLIKLELPPGILACKKTPETNCNNSVPVNHDNFSESETQVITIDDIWSPEVFELNNIFGQQMKVASFTGWRVSTCFVKFLRELVADFGINQYYPASVVMFMSNSLISGRLPNELEFKSVITTEINQICMREVIEQLELSCFDNKFIKFHPLFLLSYFVKTNLNSVIPKVPMLSYIQEPFGQIWAELGFERKFIVAFGLDPVNCIDSEDAVSFINESIVALVIKLPCFSTLTTGFNLALVIYYDLQTNEIKSMNYEIVFCVIFLDKICDCPDFQILSKYHDSLSKLQSINKEVFGTKLTGYSRTKNALSEYDIFSSMNEDHFDELMNEFLTSSFVSLDYKS